MTKEEVSEMLSRREFLAEYRFSDSAERRGRRTGLAWPPHLVVGKKIYYRRQSVERWLADQEHGNADALTANLESEFREPRASECGQGPAVI